MAEDLFLSATCLAAVATVSMVTWSVAVRYVEWDLVPRSALRRARFWQRHAQSFLLVAVMTTVVMAAGLAAVALA
jgi:uncharacterized membrane protein